MNRQTKILRYQKLYLLTNAFPNPFVNTCEMPIVSLFIIFMLEHMCSFSSFWSFIPFALFELLLSLTMIRSDLLAKPVTVADRYTSKSVFFRTPTTSGILLLISATFI